MLFVYNCVNRCVYSFIWGLISYNYPPMFWRTCLEPLLFRILHTYRYLNKVLSLQVVLSFWQYSVYLSCRNNYLPNCCKMVQKNRLFMSWSKTVFSWPVTVTTAESHDRPPDQGQFEIFAQLVMKSTLSINLRPSMNHFRIVNSIPIRWWLSTCNSIYEQGRKPAYEINSVITYEVHHYLKMFILLRARLCQAFINFPIATYHQAEVYACNRDWL